MNILLTNDDGIESESILFLKTVLEENHRVVIVAPDGNRSGYSHMVTFFKELRVQKKGEDLYACNGTPADCVLLCSRGSLPFKPDLLISGINYGPNLGHDVYYSGTAGAARQGSLDGIPSIASSFILPDREEDYSRAYTSAARFLEKNLSALRETASLPDAFVNINFPVRRRSTEITRPASYSFYDFAFREVSPANSSREPDQKVYAIAGDSSRRPPAPGSDIDAVLRNNISVSLIPTLLNPPHPGEEPAPEKFLIPE